MASLVVRNIDDGLKARLKKRAAQHGRSMEAEVREILGRELGNSVDGEGGDEDPPVIVKLRHGLKTESHDRFQIEGQAQPVSDTFDDFLDLFAKEEIPE